MRIHIISDPQNRHCDFPCASVTIAVTQINLLLISYSEYCCSTNRRSYRAVTVGDMESKGTSPESRYTVLTEYLNVLVRVCVSQATEQLMAGTTGGADSVLAIALGANYGCIIGLSRDTFWMLRTMYSSLTSGALFAT